MMMSDTPDNPHNLDPAALGDRSPNRLRASIMTDEQLAMIAATWNSVKTSETPVADLRAAMEGSDLFDLSDGATDNLALRTMALTANDTLELRHGSTRAEEARAIVDTTEGKTTPDEMRNALNDLLGETSVKDMSDEDIRTLVTDARAALTFLDTSHDRISNRELADQVSDLLDGQLVVNDADQVQYGAGATAGGENVAGRPVPAAQLHAIAAHADQIRSGLSGRGTPDSSSTSSDVGTLPPVSPDTPSTSPDTASNPTAPEAEGPLVLTFIDETHDAISAARDAAEARRRNELAEGGDGLKGKVKRFFRNMWKGENGLAGAYYLEKYKREALAQIEQENDVLALESSDSAARARAQVATIERFQSEYDESIHNEAGERREVIEGDSEFALAMKDLIRRYASGEITDPEALKAEQGRALEQLAKSGNMNLIGEGKVRLDNLLAIAEQVKAIADNEDSINRMLDGMKVYNAEARSNVRTEHELSKAEQLIDRLQRSGRGLGGLVGPETLGTAAAVALGIARAGRGTLVHAAGVTVAPGVLGGAFAAMRERKRVKQERTLHAREMAQGKSYDTGKRRDSFEDTRYETEDAQGLIIQLESLLGEGEPSTPEAIQSAYEAIASVEARIQMSDKRKIDLVAYSSVVDMPQERRKLDEARALAKVRLAGHMGDLPSDFRTRFKIVDGQPIDEALALYTGAVVELDKDIDAKDKAFRKLRLRRTALAAGIGFGTSFVIGVGAQEALAFVNPSYDGLAEHIVHDGSPSEHGHQTTLEGVREAIFGHGSTAHTEHITPSTTYDSYPMGNHQNALELPSDYHAVTAPNGSITIEGPKGFTPVEGLTLEKDGSLSPQSLELLKSHNISVADTGAVVRGETSVTQDMTVKQYNTLHSGDTTHVTRDFHYDNNTETPNANEQKLWWGGKDGNGVGENGSIQMSVTHMTAGGSTHDANHVAWAQAAHDGKLKLAVSASRDTQSQVYFVDVKADGTIDIPKDNPSSKFFSVDKSGQVQFNGAYAEVVEVRGVTDGVTHIAPLATEVGNNSLTQIPDTFPKPTQTYTPHVKLTPPAIEHAAQGRTVEGFGMPGFVPRRPLERLARNRAENAYNNYGYGYDTDGVGSEEEIARFTKERSPRLRTNPEAKLQAKEELDWFVDQLEVRHGADYIAKLDKAIQKSDELREMSGDVETIVTVPVAAAQEADTIYETLSLYGQQNDESLGKSLVLLNLNWLNTAMADPERKKKIEKARQEIQRARNDFPGLKIAVCENEYNAEEVNKTGGVIGYVAADLANAALLAVQRRMQSGAMGADHEVLIIRNDADPEGLSRNYLGSYQRALHDPKNESIDVFKGVTRFGVKWAKKYPGFAIASNFAAGLSILLSARGLPATGGANFAIKASTLAAVGGLGDMEWTGAGSDDGAIGRRIRTARFGIGVIPRSAMPEENKYKMAAHVAGATVDTNPARLIPYHLEGRPYSDAWSGDFVDGEGGYRERLAGKVVTPEGRSEIAGNWAREFEAIEATITSELRWNGVDDSRRMLALFFSGVPGAYTVSGTGKNMRFRFTAAGRQYVKERISKETDGAKGHYGDKLRRVTYGVKSPNGRRAVSASPALVQPMTAR